jgi:folate-dependent tRNA-U54 methylase TrmFO/GidA
MNANFGLLDPLEGGRVSKERKRELLAERALVDFEAWATGL